MKIKKIILTNKGNKGSFYIKNLYYTKILSPIHFLFVTLGPYNFILKVCLQGHFSI
jgi:hypothetical protein